MHRVWFARRGQSGGARSHRQAEANPVALLQNLQETLRRDQGHGFLSRSQAPPESDLDSPARAGGQRHAPDRAAGAGQGGYRHPLRETGGQARQRSASAKGGPFPLGPAKCNWMRSGPLSTRNRISVIRKISKTTPPATAGIMWLLTPSIAWCWAWSLANAAPRGSNACWRA